MGIKITGNSSEMIPFNFFLTLKSTEKDFMDFN